MNDRYTFRGKRIDNGEWVTGNLIVEQQYTSDERYFITDKTTGYQMTIDPNAIERCTGICDNNGKFIFEGDIVLIEYCSRLGQIKQAFGLIKIGVLGAGLETSVGDGCYEWIYLRDTQGDDTVYQILGNIHDNPDLLKEGLEDDQ